MSLEKEAYHNLRSNWTNWKIYRIYILLLSNRILFMSFGGTMFLIGIIALMGFLGGPEAEALIGTASILIGLFLFSLFYAPVFGAKALMPKIKIEFFEHIKASSKIRNLKYRPEGEEFTKDFLKSGLYPYKLTKIKGRDYFSGFSGYFPFLIWNVWAWFQEKSFQSPMTYATINTAYIGFAGDQVIFKNITPITGELIVFPKKAEEYYADLLQGIKAKKKFKKSGFSNPEFSKAMIAYRTASLSGITSRIFQSILEIIRSFPEGAAFHFTPEVVFVNIPHEKNWLEGSPFQNPDHILQRNVVWFFRLMRVPSLLEFGISGENQDK